MPENRRTNSQTDRGQVAVAMTTQSLDTSASSKTGAPVSESTLLDQAYDQFCLLEETGEPVQPEVFLGRYPTIQSTLRRLLDLHHGFIEEARQTVPTVRWPNAGDHYYGYQLERRLGEGASSRVFLATEPALGNRKVAVKITRRGESEAFTLGRIKHPNVIPIHSRTAIPEQQLSIICMEYLGSATLGSLLDRILASPKPLKDASAILEAARDPYAEMEAVPELHARFKQKSYEKGIRELFADVCLALEYLHRQEILHLDLKPSNILLRPDGSPVLLDFHLASDRRGLAGSFGGTYPYMPPEQLRAMISASRTPDSAVDERSDLFAVGVLMWETLTGALPFGSTRKDISVDEAVAQLLARQQAGFQAPMRDGWSVSPELVDIVRRCLSYDPRDRPATAADLRRLLVPEIKKTRSRSRILVLSSVLIAAVSLWGAVAAFGPISDDDVATHYAQGVKLFETGQYGPALEEFRWVKRARPNDVRGLRAFAIASVADATTDAGVIADALKACLDANQFRFVPDFALTGYLLQLRGDAPPEIKRQYGSAVDNGQATKAVFNNLSAIYLRSGDDVDPAIDFANKALELDPRCQPALINRALARYKKAVLAALRALPAKVREDLQKASIADLKEALVVGPPSGELHLLVAKVMATPPRAADNDKIIHHLSAAIDQGADVQREIKSPYPWDGIRHDRAFQKLIQQKGVVSANAGMKRLLAPYTELPVWDR